jgi:hypothetical protein
MVIVVWEWAAGDQPINANAATPQAATTGKRDIGDPPKYLIIYRIGPPSARPVKWFLRAGRALLACKSAIALQIA